MRSFLILASAALLAGPLNAQTATQLPAAPPSNYNPSRDIIADRLRQDLGDKQVAVLNLVAHATAAALICPTIDMNLEAIKGGVTAVINQNLPDLKTDAERQAFRDRTLVGFGALIGLSVDEAAPNKASFCHDAEEEMKEEGMSSFLVPHVEPKK